MSNRKRISNTFVVNTVEDGKSIATVLLSQNSIFYEADSYGYAKKNIEHFDLFYTLVIGDKEINNSNVTVENVEFDSSGGVIFFDEKYNIYKDESDVIDWSQIKDGYIAFDIDRSKSPHVNGILRVTLSCTYNGIEYTAVGECHILPNKQGSAGKSFYYAGVWEDLLEIDNYKFIVTDQQAPFVSYIIPSEKNPNNIYFAVFDAPNGEYLLSDMLDNRALVVQDKDYDYIPNLTSSGTFWREMTNDFTYLITKAIFGDFAKFGSAIISGDWMISQHGTIYDANGTSHAINASQDWYDESNDITYTFDNAYTLFNPSYPNSNESGKVNFIPNYAVDLKSGKTFQHDAYISGAVEATSGKIGGFNIETDEKLTLTAGYLKMNEEGIRYDNLSTNYRGVFDFGVGKNAIGGIEVVDDKAYGQKIKPIVCALQLGAKRNTLSEIPAYRPTCSALDIKYGWVTGLKRQIFSISDAIPLNVSNVVYFEIICDLVVDGDNTYTSWGEKYFRYPARSGAFVIINQTQHILLPNSIENGTFYTFLNISGNPQSVVANSSHQIYNGDSNWGGNYPRAQSIASGSLLNLIFYDGFWYKY